MFSPNWARPRSRTSDWSMVHYHTYGMSIRAARPGLKPQRRGDADIALLSVSRFRSVPQTTQGYCRRRSQLRPCRQSDKPRDRIGMHGTRNEIPLPLVAFVSTQERELFDRLDTFSDHTHAE